MTNKALLPCPFCGKTLNPPTAVQYPKSGPARFHPGDLDDGLCPIAGWGFYDEQLATWNTRAHEAPLLVRIAELEGVAMKMADILAAIEDQFPEASPVLNEFGKINRAMLKHGQ